MQLVAPPLWTKSVTLATANTAYNLYALLVAIDPYAPATGRIVNIQVSFAVPGGVRRGDSTLTTTSCGGEMNVGDTVTYSSGDGVSDVPLNMIYLMPSVNSIVVNVEVVG